MPSLSLSLNHVLLHVIAVFLELRNQLPPFRLSPKKKSGRSKTVHRQTHLLSLAQSPEARGYQMLSVMRAMMMMPNANIFSCLHSSDMVGGELQLVFPISQEDFDSLLSGELQAEVHPVLVPEVVHSGVKDAADLDMRFAATISEWLLTRLEFVEVQVQTQENTLQLQFLLAWNTALEREVEELKQGLATLEGEFRVLVARMDGLERGSLSEYLSIDKLLCMDLGTVPSPLSLDEALALGIRQDYGPLETVTQLIPITEDEEQEIEDHLVSAWQAQGRAQVHALHHAKFDHHPYHKAVGNSTNTPHFVYHPDVRAECTVSSKSITRGLSGEMQIVFPLDIMDFDALSSEHLDNFDVHGLYNNVVWYRAVNDATDKMGNNILEVVPEENPEDWTDEE
ncbi:hypothetical protein BDM02DRAFT_3193917 [Thelephora ganbajun]|uniref:Uncharacterized protein n=1 Tax=Thelephora ganbajun TaxID=370292 RepID=A0ACB6YXT5_THEGA|nr:hypothetical protein BDM02DRAFT_3193917 [Thelephora ganbajun]